MGGDPSGDGELAGVITGVDSGGLLAGVTTEVRGVVATCLLGATYKGFPPLPILLL